MFDHSFNCPYCWEEVSILLEPAEELQDFTTDCEVCCRPISISLQFDGEEIYLFDVGRELDE